MLPDIRKLNREDLQEAPNWIEPILDSLNTFMDSVYDIMYRNISLVENLNMQIITLTVKTKSDGSISPIKQKLNIKGKVTGLVVLRVLGEDSVNISAPFINWNQSSNILEISKIAGLNNSKEYKIIVLIVGE